MNRISKVSLFAASGIATAFLAVACGRTEETDRVKIKLGLSTGAYNLEGLSLNDWTIKIAGCKSGFTATINSTTAASKTAVNMYKFDRECKAGLESFSYGGEIYTKDGGGVLDTAAGTQAVFKSPTAKSITIGVSAQLDSPLTAASKASFQFFEVKKGAGYSAQFSQAQTLSVSGVEAPNFSINKVDLLDVLATSGAGQFSFAFECGKTIATPANTCETTGLEAQPMASMDVKLVEDTFGGTLTYDQAKGLFPVDLGTVATVDGTVGAKGGMKITLDGPGQLDAKRDLIVAIRYKTTGGDSFVYYTVTVERPSN